MDLLSEVVTLIVTLGTFFGGYYKLTSRLEKKMLSNKLDIMRLEILHALDHDDGAIEIILDTHDKYKALGGNSYVDIRIAQRKKKKGLPV